jgi:hypothetical protein
MTKDNAAILDNIMSELFHYPTDKGFQPGGHLHIVIEVMFATLLKSYEEMKDKRGTSDYVCAAVLTACRKFKIERPTVEEWCAEVNQDWLLRNYAHRSEGGGSGGEGTVGTMYLLQHIERQGRELTNLRGLVSDLRADLKLSTKVQEDIFAMLKTLNGATVHIPSPERRRKVRIVY